MLRIAVRGEPTTFVDLGPAVARPTVSYTAVGANAVGAMLPVLSVGGQPVSNGQAHRRHVRSEAQKARRRFLQAERRQP